MVHWIFKSILAKIVNIFTTMTLKIFWIIRTTFNSKKDEWVTKSIKIDSSVFFLICAFVLFKYLSHMYKYLLYFCSILTLKAYQKNRHKNTQFLFTYSYIAQFLNNRLQNENWTTFIEDFTCMQIISVYHYKHKH